MPLSFPETHAVAQLSQHLYDYLPGSSYGNRAYTFADAAAEVGVTSFWAGGSKLPAITTLLELTLDRSPRSFCPLVEAIVRGGLKYRALKGNPLTQEDVAELNRLVQAAGHKIPSLWDPMFAATLPRRTQVEPEPQEPQRPDPVPPVDSQAAIRSAELERLLAWFMALNALEDRQRAGRELEKLLHELFSLFGLDPRGAFMIVGEQLDGSIVLDSDSFLVEAKWEQGHVELAPLLTFREKVAGKSAMTYGIFLSVNGYTAGAREGITHGRQPNFFMLDGRHLYAVLNDEVDLVLLLRALRRELADRGRPYVPLPELRPVT